jgi:5'(3')-deoxyribonucleotidase
MTRFAIDMDDVLADTLGAELAWFRERYGYRWTRADLTGKERFDDMVAPEHAAAHAALLRDGSFFGELQVMPDAVRVVRRLAERSEVFVASSATEFPGSMLPKLRWLERHFPFLPACQVVFCGDKSILNADVLIDDNAHRFARFQGQRVLFDAPHNAGQTGLLRVGSWSEVERLFLDEP